MATGNFWEGLGAGSYSALNSALMGLPDFLVEKVGGSENAKYLKELRERNKEASMAGDIAGTVGSMFIPGGAIVKGLGMGAKALGAGKVAANLAKAGQFMAGGGGKLGTQMLRSGANALESGILRSAFDTSKDEEGNEKDLGQRAMDVVGGTITGGVLGGALGTGLQRVLKPGTASWAAGELAEKGNKAVLSAVSPDVNTRSINQFLKASGAGLGKGEKGERVVADLAGLVKKYGVRNDQDVDGIMELSRQMWGKIGDDIAAQGDEFTTRVLKSLPKEVDLSDLPKSSDKIVKDIISQLDTDPNLARNQLSNIIRSYSNATNPADKITQMVATRLKDKFDDKLVDLAGISGEELAKAKEVFKLSKFFDYAKRGEAARIENINLGSGTAEKLLGQETLKKLGTAGAGTGLGAIVGGAQGETPEEKLQNALTYGLGGAALGAGAKKLFEKVGTGALKAGTRGLSEVMEKYNIPLLAGKADEVLTGLAESGKAGQIADTAGLVGARLPSALGTTEDTEKKLETPEVAEIKTSPQYQSMLQGSLEQMYNQYYTNMSPEEFIEKVKVASNDFDPTNPVTAKILFQGDQAMVEQYLQDIKSLQGIKEYDKGVDIPFIAENKEKEEVKQNLTNLLVRDVGDIGGAEKEADKWLRLVDEGKLSMQDLKSYIVAQKAKYLNQIGVQA